MADELSRQEEALVRTRASRDIRRMFHDIAPSYDFLNHLLSFNVDHAWRRITARKVITPQVEHVLDVCSGTGDLALAFARHAKKIGTAPIIIGSDFTAAMSERAKAKFGELQNAMPGLQVPMVGDVLQLPFPDRTFDVVSVAFGIRNVQDIPAGIREMTRVCKPGGQLAILEFSHPRNLVFRRVYELYFFRVLPGIGRLLTGTRAYSYLPKSVAKFPDTEEFTALMKRITGGAAQAYRLSFGIATLYLVTVPGD